MKKSFILNKSIKSLVGTAAILGTSVFVITACQINQNNREHFSSQLNSTRELQKKLLNKVNYLAIGDSVTAGFNLDSRIDSRGNLEDGQVSGLSYPAFFARFLQQIKPDSLVSFDNLALSGTTVKNWLYLLEPTNKEYANYDKTFLKYAHNIDAKVNSPYGQQISDVFGNFSANEYPKFIKKIQDANLLTFTLGANDLFQSLNFSYLTSLSDNNLASKTVIAEQVQRDVANALEQIKTNLTKLVEKIKKINPKLRINILGYQDLNSSAIKFVGYLLKNELGFSLDFGNSVITKLNSYIKQVALQEEINYIDPYDQTDWKNNKIFSVDFDIHPSAKGYKKMAQALLYKLALDQSDIFNLKGVDVDFLQKNKNDYTRVLDIASNQDIIKEVNDKTVLETSDYEAQNQQKLASYQASAQNMFVAFLDTDSVIEKWIVNLLSKSGDFQSIAKVFLKQNTTDAWNKTKEFLKELAQSPILNQILQALQSYIKEVQDSNTWDKITFESVIDGISRKFLLEGGLPALINFVLNNDIVSQQPEALKQALFKTVFSSASIQNRILSLFSDENSDNSDWRVIFEFDSTRLLFTKVLNELLDNGKNYKSSTNFADLVTNFVKNDANQSSIISFVQNFTTDALKQHVFTTLLVNLIDRKAHLDLSEQDKDGISLAMLGLAENITSTKTFKNLAKSIAISLTNSLKTINSKFNKEKLSQLFISTLATSFKNFFSNKENLLVLVQDLLQSQLNENQVEILSKLLQRLTSVISSLDLSTFYSSEAKNYSVVKVLFDSAKEFLQQNSFAQINELFTTALKDFFITHRDKYSSSIDFDSFVFQLVANNSDKIKDIIYKFLISQGEKDDFNNAISTLLAGFLDKYNYSQNTKNTISKIITAILEDFAKHSSSNNSQDNIITLLLDQFTLQMKDYVATNYNKQDQAKDDYKKTDNQQEQTKYADEYLTLRSKLNFDDFLAKFAQTTIKNSNFLYSALKSFARIFENNTNIKEQITTNELADAIFDILKSQPVLEFFKNSIPAGSDSTLREELSSIISKFLSSEQLHELLKSGMEFIFKTSNLNQYQSLSQLLLGFLKEKRDLVDKAIAIFIGTDEASGDLNNILDKLLKANWITLSSTDLSTLQQIIKDFAHKTRQAIETKTVGVYKPLTINAVINFVITNLFSDNPQDFNNGLIDLVSNVVYDISHIYFKDSQTSDSSVPAESNKVDGQKLLSLLKGFLNSDFATRTFNEKFGEDQGKKIKDLITFFLSTNGTEKFVTDIFKLIAKQDVTESKSVFNILKDVVNDSEFPNILVTFIKSIPLNELSSKLKPIFSKILGVELSDAQINSFLKWAKLILTDNIDGKVHNYTDTNDLIKTFVQIFKTLFEQRAQNKNFDFTELKRHFVDESFIVNFIKQLAATFKNGEGEDRINEEDKRNIGKLVVSVLNSSFIKNTIDSIDLSSLQIYLGNEFESDSQQIKEFIKTLISQPGNADFIVSVLNEVGINIDSYKDVTSVIDLLKKIIYKNKDVITKYLWQIIDYAVNNNDMSKIFSKIIASQLKLTNMTEDDYNKIGNFLKALVDRGNKSEIVLKILNLFVDKLGQTQAQQFDANFFSTTFNSISSSQVFDFDFVVKIDNDLKNSTSQREWQKIDNKQENTLLTANIFAEFFDIILTKAPRWNSNKQNEGSIILRGLNNITYTGIDYAALIIGGEGAKSQQTQLSSIANIFWRVYSSLGHEKITYDNFKNTPAGRTLYRLMFLTLFYAWESQFKGAWSITKNSGFYGSLLNSSTASGKIFAALKNAIPKGSTNKSEYDNFVDQLHGEAWNKEATKGWGWFKTKGDWYNQNNVKPSDMLTMIFYNESPNPFTNTTTHKPAKEEEPTLKDQILEQIRKGSFEGWENKNS